MPPSLLLTRPEDASRRFAAGLAHLGLTVVISPVLRIVPVTHDAAALSAAAGLVFTSVHAVPAAGPGRGRPAICVGPATGQAARAAGFAVTEGPGDAARMMPLLTGLGTGWIHPHGAHIAKELPVPGMVVYDQQPLPPSVQAEALLAGAGPVILPVFSPRSSRLVSDWARGASAPRRPASIRSSASASQLRCRDPCPPRPRGFPPRRPRPVSSCPFGGLRRLRASCSEVLSRCFPVPFRPDARFAAGPRPASGRHSMACLRGQSNRRPTAPQPAVVSPVPRSAGFRPRPASLPHPASVR